MLAVVCNFSKPSKNCLCEELNKTNKEDSLPENIQNYSLIWGSPSFDSTMTASATTSIYPSPSSGFNG